MKYDEIEYESVIFVCGKSVVHRRFGFFLSGNTQSMFNPSRISDCVGGHLSSHQQHKLETHRVSFFKSGPD